MSEVYRSVRRGLLRSLGGPQAIGRLYGSRTIRRALRAARDGRMTQREADDLNTQGESRVASRRLALSPNLLLSEMVRSPEE